MSIKDQNGLSVTQLAELLDVSESSVRNYLLGAATNQKIAKKMANLGIEHPVRSRCGHSSANSSNHKKAVREFKSDILKEHQVAIVRQYGNTIVSKKYKAEDIINEFARFGLSVELTDFQDKTHYDWNTHYVATLVGGSAC